MLFCFSLELVLFLRSYLGSFGTHPSLRRHQTEFTLSSRAFCFVISFSMTDRPNVF